MQTETPKHICPEPDPGLMPLGGPDGKLADLRRRVGIDGLFGPLDDHQVRSML
jgi:hypothetical protein